MRTARGLLAEYADGSSGSPTYASELESVFAYPARTGSGYVVDCLWSAWDALTAAGNYVETVQRAVAYGHDTDTTAAVAGGLAGAWYGLDQVPAEWRADLRLDSPQRQMLEQFADAVTVDGRPARWALESRIRQALQPVCWTGDARLNPFPHSRTNHEPTTDKTLESTKRGTGPPQ